MLSFGVLEDIAKVGGSNRRVFLPELLHVFNDPVILGASCAVLSGEKRNRSCEAQSRQPRVVGGKKESLEITVAPNYVECQLDFGGGRGTSGSTPRQKKNAPLSQSSLPENKESLQITFFEVASNYNGLSPKRDPHVIWSDCNL